MPVLAGKIGPRPRLPLVVGQEGYVLVEIGPGAVQLLVPLGGSLGSDNSTKVEPCANDLIEANSSSLKEPADSVECAGRAFVRAGGRGSRNDRSTVGPRQAIMPEQGQAAR